MRSKRLYKIVKTFLTYGLDELIPRERLPFAAKVARASLFWLRNKHKDKPVEQRFRLAIESLGPVFIKFGQMLSTRRDLLSDDLAKELALLQDKVNAFDGEQAKRIIVDAIGEEKFQQTFSDFDTQPLASASIAQVHAALMTIDGDEKNVVIKVIRPRIEKVIHADIHVMQTFAALLSRFYTEGKRLRPVEVVNEYKKTIIDELDLLREAANAIQLKRNFEGDPILHVPEVYSEYCSKNVMVMERIYGVGVGEVDKLHELNVNMPLLAERGVEVFFTQVFRDSFFHADMHPGNVFVDVTNVDDPTWIAIDCGIVGTLNKEDKRYLAENFVAFFNRDYHKVAQLHVDSGWVPRDTSIDEFEFAIRTVCEPIFEKPLAEISFGQVLVNLFNTARRFNMEVQPQLVLLQKTLLYIEGLGRQLYPQLDLWKTAKPFLEDWVKEQMGPKALFNSIKENLPYWAEKMPELPNMVYQYLDSGHKNAEQQQLLLAEMQHRQHKQFKRLRLAIIGCSLMITSAVLYSFEHGVSAAVCAGLSTFVLALSMRRIR
ncbi:ubiquinone biosynthesis regulatory protein kinase UbiB [Thalassotalea sp. HSM 43]|uniref:ubiquinone biosynthesis regulatory protein kinase UbiB n=1 Tax=Thalassotalea sp. HSM 43 TaxID=2552945 RepID=UPI00108110EB|nr:ubiquinone biosynthesis regulatory protein kinase UbiB [Thalassotalea sp. HSM 43]QBY04145.1 ubiquinone biosynthesis regulatory protein kinase UbiB [Thalassotalea sp. HSM 43]